MYFTRTTTIEEKERKGMDIKLYALIKSMITGVTKGERGDTGKDGRDGESGLMTIINASDIEPGYTLYNNGEYHISFESELTFDIDFSKNHDGSDADPTKTSQCAMMFTVPETANEINVPENVAWSVASPVFSRGRTYLVSFLSAADGYVGVWTVIA